MRLVFVNQVPSSGRIPRSGLLRVASRAQTSFSSKLRATSVSVVFVSKRESKKLNATYRGRRKPTNALSFASTQSGELGDIVICPALARKEARAAHQGFGEYVRYLFVHGLLHLLGFDHRSARAEQRMERTAARILNTK